MASGLGLLTTGKSLGHSVRLVSGGGLFAGFLGSYVVGLAGVMAVIAWYFAIKDLPPSEPASFGDPAGAVVGECAPDGLGGVHHQPAQSA